MTAGLGLTGIKRWLDAGLGFFYPPVCQLCMSESADASEGFVGGGCRRAVRPVRPPICDRCGLPYEGDISTPFVCGNCSERVLHFRYARAGVIADGPVREAIHRYKYHRALWFEPFLAGFLVRAAHPMIRLQTWDLIVPVPLHPVKHREREFNQAERLARRLGRELKIPVNTRVLKRVEATATQTRLSRAERARNVLHAFKVRAGSALGGQRIVIVDDVLTTGATASACARALRRAGAVDVCVWTVARGT